MDSYEDFAGSLRHTNGNRLLDLDATLISKAEGANADSRLHNMKFTNEQAVVVNTRPSGEFYEVMGGKGILRRQ